MAQTTSELWKTLWRMPNTEREYQFDINGKIYGPEHEVEHTYSSGLYEDFGIGNAATASLTLGVFAPDIPRGATIKRYMRLRNGDQVSEWLPKGTFFPNRRIEDDGYWTIEAFDPMRKAEVVWEPDQSLSFPMTMPDAVKEIARIMDVPIDSRTVLDPSYPIDYPANEYTLRDELCFIAAAHGGNWIITDAGALWLVPTIAANINKFNIGLDITSFDLSGKYEAISRVTLLVDDENALTAGNDTGGRELVASCPHATQSMVNAILAKVKGYQYIPYNAGAANLDPAAELGDGVIVSGTDSIIARIEDDGEGYPNISAPGKAELEDEYPTESPFKKEFNRKIAQTNSRITKTAEQIRLEVKNEVDGLSSSFSVTLNEIKGEITGVNGELSTVKQTVSGFDVRIQSAQDKASQAIQTANGFELKINNAEKNAKAALDAVNGLKIEVSNGTESSTLKLMAGSTALSSKEIKFTGMVTFAGLSNGTTTIDGACIKTGKISADRIDVSTLKVNKIYTSGYEKVAVQTVGTRALYLGGDGSYSFGDIYLYAGTKVYFTKYRDFNSGLEINLSSYEIKSSYSMWKLGTTIYPFNEVHCSKLYVDGKQVVAQSGDKDVTQLKNSIYTASLTSSGYFTPSSTQMSLGQSSSYWANAYIKQLYLSSTCYITAGGSDSITVGTKTISATPKISTLYSGSYYVQLSSTALLPGSTSYNLGNTSKYWNYVYARILRLYYNNYSYIDLSCNSSKKLCVNNTAIH